MSEQNQMVVSIRDHLVSLFDNDILLRRGNPLGVIHNWREMVVDFDGIERITITVDVTPVEEPRRASAGLLGECRCPQCKMTNPHLSIDSSGGDGWRMSCLKCGCYSGDFSTEEEAANHWMVANKETEKPSG